MQRRQSARSAPRLPPGVAASLFHGRGYIAVNKLKQLLMDARSIKDRVTRNHIKFMRENGIIEVNG